MDRIKPLYPVRLSPYGCGTLIGSALAFVLMLISCSPKATAGPLDGRIRGRLMAALSHAALNERSLPPAPAPAPAPGTTTTCTNCGGKGRVGDGTVSTICVICDGKGKVTTGDATTYEDKTADKDIPIGIGDELKLKESRPPQTQRYQTQPSQPSPSQGRSRFLPFRRGSLDEVQDPVASNRASSDGSLAYTRAMVEESFSLPPAPGWKNLDAFFAEGRGPTVEPLQPNPISRIPAQQGKVGSRIPAPCST